MPQNECVTFKKENVQWYKKHQGTKGCENVTFGCNLNY